MLKISVVDVCLISLSILPLLGACAQGPEPTAGSEEATAEERAADPHSFARPGAVAVTHLALDLTVDFEQQRLAGRASLDVDNKTGADRLYLDTRGLEIQKVTLDDGTETEFSLGDEMGTLGQELAIQITPETERVHVDYRTSPGAAALQWLEPAQTATDHPFLFTQSQAILARTWIPLQDTPGVRMTYEATVRVPKELLAVMSAENPTERSADGVYHFAMPQAIPSYLLALAVGDLEFRALGERSGVYAEPPVVERAAWELADTERMMAAAEKLYGPYRWGRYDLLVLPPSFPFGGMENPRLTFATPTILAGDRSLVALVAHELAHSWSGNLVTNATWDDFWLNEGFTTYFENRIMEELYGPDYAEMLLALGVQDLRDTIDELGADNPDTHLRLDLAGRDPDEGMTSIAYEKGALFLHTLEKTVGRERWDAFLRTYFDKFAFQPMDTTRFVDYLKRNLLTPEEIAQIDLDAWIYGPGVPAGAVTVEPTAFARVEAQIAAWSGGTPAAELDTGGWTTHHWLHFLRNLPEGLPPERLADLDRAFELTDSGNSEILAVWLERAIESGYEPAYPALERFLTGMGRRKFLRPLYTALAETPEGKARAMAIYEKARPGYHAVSAGTIDQILGWGNGAS